MNQTQQPGSSQQPDMLQMQLAQIAQQNPEVTQRMTQLLSQGASEGAFDIPPQMLPQIEQMVRAVAQNPSLWPQMYQQAIQMGASPQILPPPDAAPQQIMQFVAALFMVMHLMGEMGQGRSGGQANGMGGMPVQGFAAGGMVLDNFGASRYGVQGFAQGGMVPPTMAPMAMPTGDDQLIAAQAGEGVLNRQAVQMIGGPDAVNNLNYQASGMLPGGQTMFLR